VKRRNIVGVVLVILVVVVVGAGLAIAGMGPWATPLTLVVGDSVTNLSRVEIEATTGARVDAQNGYTWAEMAPKVRGSLAVMKSERGVPERVGVLLGYNDVLTDRQDLEATRTVLEEFSDVPCVVVLTLPKLWNRDAAGYNAEVRAIVDDLPNTSTDDGWARFVNDNLDNGAALLEADLVHPKPGAARQAVADSYQQAFDRHC
jgi:hypothetical protein